MKKRVKKPAFLLLLFVLLLCNMNVNLAADKKYKIIYKTNVGKNNIKNPATYTSKKAVKLYKATRTGYKFSGWFLEKKYLNQIKKIKKGTTGKVKLYAKWTVKNYKIRYYLNGGTNNKKNPETYAYNKAVKLYSPSNGKKIFAGWYTDSNFKNKITKIPKHTTGKIKLYAKWDPEQYKISYALNGGTNHPDNPSKYSKGSVVVLQSPSREGYTFQGWYKESSFITKIDQIASDTTDKVKLYAKWELENYAITYELNGGSNVAENPTSYTCEEQIILKAPSKNNCIFQGWYLESTFENKVDMIPAGSVGAIQLYAKWYLEALNINQTGGNDMIWSWWYYPQAISTMEVNQRLFWGFATSEGYSGIAEYNKATGEIKKTILKKSSSTDDHNGLALSIMGDGRILCAYSGGHNKDNEIHIRISNESSNIDRFDTDIVLESSGKTCYSQILRYLGKYYVFYRVDNKNWACRSSLDGYEWSDEKILVTASMQYYCKFVPTTEDRLLRVCMYSNPSSSDPSIRMGFYDLENEVFLRSDQNTVMGTDHISQKNFDVLIPTTEGLTQRMFDVAVTEPSRTEILFATFSLDTAALDSQYYLYDTGATAEICHGGNPLWNPKYQCGAAFIGTDQIVLSRNENGCDQIELYGCENGFAFLKELIYQEEIGDTYLRNVRPIVDINGVAFLWHRGPYDQNSYKNFNTEAMIYFLEE